MIEDGRTDGQDKNEKLGRGGGEDEMLIVIIFIVYFVF